MFPKSFTEKFVQDAPALTCTNCPP